MPIHKVSGGYKWGSHGHVYPTRKGAEKQAEAAYAHGYKGDASLEKGASQEAISKHIGQLIDRGYPQAQAVAIAYREAGKSRKDSVEEEEYDEPAEIDYARAMRDGYLEGPISLGNLWLFDVRITGTGSSYREKLDEFVYRPPEEYLTDEFLERCQGLPVIFEHPESSMLDTQEYRDRAIGSIVLPYIPKEEDEKHQTDEVWGIARIYDGDAAELMQTTHISTSPAVGFGDSGGTRTVKMDDGETLLIEGRPQSLDHLAICPEGVWDKGEKPRGVA